MSTAILFLFFFLFLEERGKGHIVWRYGFFKKRKLFNIKRVGIDNFKSPVTANN